MKHWSGVKPFYVLILLTITTGIFTFYLSLAADNPFSQLEPMLEGSAPRPYVYRVLVPLVVRVVSKASHIPGSLVAIGIMYGSLLGFTWAFLALAGVFLPPQHSRSLALLAPIGLIPFLFEQRHIYDFPILFLFTLALYFLATGQLARYLVVFLLASLTKETSLFLVLFFALQLRGVERYRTWLAVQILLYALVRLALIMAFQNNPGGLVEFHFFEHGPAYLEHPLGSAMLFLGMLITIAMGFSLSPDRSFVLCALLAIGGPTLILYFFFGVPFEVRIFLETYPAMVLAGACSICNLIVSARRALLVSMVL